ncbi:DbpA RNA binding domain-containing protein [Treponema socranskii subsp. buccale]|uniref:DbpA RNA binding domain-containing protein n=1 Tax=Treponema socranskii TaxID=53419 RepID=UPI0020A5A68C|nr:DbpA RNA binding domain-containing protein [Treponema socranskii]UTD03523.1 DbpA RNA binding domain-containing protein [Treponema socranskii subsp. buccale]
MAFQREIEIDKERVTSFLKNALNKVMTEENPDLLNDLKKIFKRTIPFSKRMYVAAYLTKEMQGRFHGAPNARRNDIFMHGVRGGRNFKDASYGRPSYNDRRGNGESLSDELRAEAHTPHPRVQIDESLAATIFISIGRNRRVYPRDLVGLLVSVAGLDRDRIGDIRVLANYSFVQLFKDDTEKAIAALNGYDYRGRKLAVSFSRQRDDASENGGNVYPSDDVHDTMQTTEDAKAYAAAEKAAQDKEPFTAPSYKSEDENAEGDGYLV